MDEFVSRPRHALDDLFWALVLGFSISAALQVFVSRKKMKSASARPCSGESDQAFVAGAWDFDQINRRYQDCLSLLKKPPARKQTGDAKDIARLHQWARRERVLWHAAIQGDPLLPAVLLPIGYRGKEAWSLRNSVLRKAGEWLE